MVDVIKFKMYCPNCCKHQLVSSTGRRAYYRCKVCGQLIVFSLRDLADGVRECQNTL